MLAFRFVVFPPARLKYHVTDYLLSASHSMELRNQNPPTRAEYLLRDYARGKWLPTALQVLQVRTVLRLGSPPSLHLASPFSAYSAAL